ncbi:heavy-metal resistance protein [Rhodobacter aestuarii]|uniref:Heavy-metal resistance n=1 Tax=Rhodobacter aestuarii TaxID=453582 RepID=A0A1N7MMG5_9RHOB|nr:MULTISPECIES: periplasmic heavy metal sensor [Rhodobacter]PTV96661.1 heavy-metal resistance protein [Rhodobacter aestuarii]SIS87242.1 Heavy-metal resistance [Rhodobacter aestuarii]SOB90958.1 heavy-metal resistance protein [Rhodobacter sp. JA431]
MTNETEQTPTPAGTQGRLRGGTKVVFILSLVLNFLVIGVVAGGVIGHMRGEPPPRVLDRDGPDQLSFGPLGGAFTREDRIEMRRAAEGQGRDFGAMQGQMRSDFERLDAALRAQPYDEAALHGVLTEMRARTLERIEMGEQVMLSRIAAMSDEERAAFADRMQRGVERFQRRLDERREDWRERRRPAD